MSLSSVVPVLRLAASAALAATVLPAVAADRASPAEVRARYETERAACNVKPSPDERATCLRDAAAARDAALRGELELPAGTYGLNREARCDALPEADRDACRRRAREEGATTGSVSGGGVLREYRELTLTPPPPSEGASGTAGNTPGAATAQPLTR